MKVVHRVTYNMYSQSFKVFTRNKIAYDKRKWCPIATGNVVYA